VHRGEVRVQTALPGVVEDRRVVDEHVEPPVLLGDPGGGGRHARLVGDVERDGLDLEPLPGQLAGRALALRGVAGGEEDEVAAGGELAGDLEADPPVRARDEDRSRH